MEKAKIKIALLLLIIVYFLNYSFALTPLNFTYRKEITINNSLSQELNDYQIKIKINASNFDFSKINETCQDIRFADSDEVTFLPYWIEECNKTKQEAIFWIRVNISANSMKNIYMYYGNNKITNESNGSTVFDFFDDFENWEGWTDYGSGSVVQDDTRAFRNNKSAHKINNNDPNGAYKDIGKTLTRGIILEAWVNRNNAANGGPWDRIGVIDNNGNGYGSGANARRCGSNNFLIDKRNSYSGSIVYFSGTCAQRERWYMHQLIIKEDSVVARWFDKNGNLLAEGTRNDNAYNSFTRVYIFGGHDYWVDEMRIRKYASIEPEIVIDSEELVDKNAPSILFTNETLSNSTYMNKNFFVVRVNVNDVNLKNLTFYLYNNSSLINKTTKEINKSGIYFVNFTNLTEGIYFFEAIVYDKFGLSNKTEKREIVLDFTKPNITEIEIETTKNKAIIKWKTNEAANSSVNYGNSKDLGNVVENTRYTFNHSIEILDLASGKIYYFNITSCDKAGNCKTEGAFEFKTKSGGGSSSRSKYYKKYRKIKKIDRSINVVDITKEINEENSAIIKIEKNKKIVFKIKEIEEKHEIIINDFNLTHANITIFSNTINLMLVNGTPYNIDLNFDGKTDIIVTYIYPKIKIEKMVEEKEIKTEMFDVPTINQTEKEERIEEKNFKFFILILTSFTFLILILITGYIGFLKRHTKIEKKLKEIEEELKKDGYNWKIKGIIRED